MALQVTGGKKGSGMSGAKLRDSGVKLGSKEGEILRKISRNMLRYRRGNLRRSEDRGPHEHGEAVSGR